MNHRFPNQPDPFRRPISRKRANKRGSALPPSLAGTEEQDAKISIHPIMLKRLEWLAGERGKPAVSPTYLLDEMLWFAMEHGPYAAPDFGGWTVADD